MTPSICGTPDYFGNRGSSWGLDTLTWAIQQPIPALKNEQHELTEQVFASISAVCGLSFRPVVNVDQANIVFTVSRMGRDRQFDGAGGVLAYAYLPPTANYRGKGLACVFDLDENWQAHADATQQAMEILFPNVCGHEVLHNLGGSHLKPPKGVDALLEAIYDRRVAVPQRYDQEQFLWPNYGKPKPVPDNPLPPREAALLELCAKVNGVEVGCVDVLGLFGLDQ